MSDYDLINGEILTVSVTVDEEVITAEINTAARGPAGPAGGGTNSVTSATTSDGTANLSLSNVTTATATVTGTLTADHIHGNLAGNVYGHVRAGEALAKGDPVYVSGSHGSGVDLIPIVSKADASNAAKMPAIGIMDAAVANKANGHMVIVGTITELNTAAYSVNAELYVASGGGFTATPPTARAQPVARVERANANNGAVIVKVNGLSASDATANTLVRRTSGGGASFQDINAASVESGTIESTTLLQATALEATGNAAFQGSVEFQTEDFTYGTGAAEAHRIALGGASDSSTGTALFGAATVAAANQILGMVSGTAKGTTAAAGATTNVVSLSIPSAGLWRIEALSTWINASSSSTLMGLLFDANAVIPATNFRIGQSMVNTTMTALTVVSPGLTAAIGATLATASSYINSTAFGLIETTAASTLILRVQNTAGAGTSTVTQASLSATKL